jgi:hypothetical protein
MPLRAFQVSSGTRPVFRENRLHLGSRHSNQGGTGSIAARGQTVKYGSSTLTSVILFTGSPLRSATRRIASGDGPS